MKTLGIFSVPAFFCVVPSANSAICMSGVFKNVPMMYVLNVIFSPIFAMSFDGVISKAYEFRSDLSMIFMVIILVSFVPSVRVIICVITFLPGF